jgi:hypothetical protein
MFVSSYDDELAKTGHYIAASALQPLRTAKTVRHRGGRPMVTDGPFAETKEALGGFILIGVLGAVCLGHAVSHRP